MGDKVQITGVEEARAKLPSILRAAHQEGTVTIVTKRGVPYAAVVPVSHAIREAPKLTELRGSRRGLFWRCPAVCRRTPRRMALRDIRELPLGRVVVDSAPIIYLLEDNATYARVSRNSSSAPRRATTNW